jgi:hypothetical protein
MCIYERVVSANLGSSGQNVPKSLTVISRCRCGRVNVNELPRNKILEIVAPEIFYKRMVVQLMCRSYS